MLPVQIDIICLLLPSFQMTTLYLFLLVESIDDFIWKDDKIQPVQLTVILKVVINRNNSPFQQFRGFALRREGRDFLISRSETKKKDSNKNGKSAMCA